MSDDPNTATGDDATPPAHHPADDASAVPVTLGPAVGASGRAGPSPTAAPDQHAMTPERQRLLRRLTPTLLVVGAILLVVFESTITLLLGVTLLLSAVVCGVFMIAEPGFLAADDPE